MAEAYYSSDEEIAWGPPQLREIKKHLFKPTKPPNCRFSEFYDWDKYDTESNDTVSSSDYHSTNEEIKICSDIKSILTIEDLMEQRNDITKESVTKHNTNQSNEEEYNFTSNQNQSEVIVISDDSDCNDESNDLIKIEQPSTSEESESFSHNQQVTNSISNTSNYSSDGNFNDTIDEMDFFLKCNKYSSNKLNDTSSIESSIKTEPDVRIDSPTNLNQFKTPSRLLNTHLTPQTLTSNRFKHVISPVSVYIKSSRPCLKKTIHAKTTKPMQTGLYNTGDRKLSIADDTICELPEIVYKPKSKTIIVSKQELNLPPSYKKIVRDATVTQHERKCDNRSQSDIQRKLCDEDISILPNTTDDEISFISTKKPFLY